MYYRKTVGSLLTIVAFTVGCQSEFAHEPVSEPAVDPSRPFVTPGQLAQLPLHSQPADRTADSHLTPPGATVIDFEGFACNVSITNQYLALGVTFTGADILVLGSCLNPNFPPHSGTGVVFDGFTSGGVITAAFTSPVHFVGGYVTGNTLIHLECFDGSGGGLGADTTSGPNFLPGGVPNEFLSVSAPGIASCRFSDTGNTYTVDDFTFVPAIAITIDIMPDRPGNLIEAEQDDLVSVLVLATAMFDPGDIDVSTLRLGDEQGAEASVATWPDGTLRYDRFDPDGDGDQDLLVLFETADLVANGDLPATATHLVLTGQTTAGLLVRGMDSVVVRY